MADYKRGDIIGSEEERAKQNAKLIERGEDIEELIQSKGWKYIADFLQVMINNHSKNINSLILQREDINVITDMTILIKAYEFLLHLPKEFILKKDMANKELGVK